MKNLASIIIILFSISLFGQKTIHKKETYLETVPKATSIDSLLTWKLDNQIEHIPYTDLIDKLEQDLNIGSSYNPNDQFTISSNYTTVVGDKDKKGRIRINPEIPSSDRNLRGVIIHEMVHAVTWDEVNKKNAFQDEILAISKELKEYLDSPESSTIQKGVRESFEYAISSPHELLTVALADDQLLLDLAKVKTKKEVSLAAKFYKVVSNHLKSIFTRRDSRFYLITCLSG